jgi:hypothetical protein
MCSHRKEVHLGGESSKGSYEGAALVRLLLINANQFAPGIEVDIGGLPFVLADARSDRDLC